MPEVEEKKVLTLEQLDALLTEKIKGALEPLTKVDRKFGILPTDNEEDLEKITGQERSLKFLKAVFFKDRETAIKLSGKALVEGTTTAGGYLVPDEFKAEVLRIANAFGLARRLCRVVPMTSDQQYWPSAGATGVTVYWPNEVAQITESTPNFGQVSLTAKKMAGITGMANELVADATVDILSYLYTLFAEAIAGEEDSQWLVGSGSPITGLLGSGSVNVVTMSSGNTSFANVTADDLLDLIDAVDDNSESNAAFYFHKNILKHLRKLKDSNGQYIWNQPANNAPGTIWGYPYHVSSKMPSTSDDGVSTKFIAFGDGKYTMFGDRKQISVDVTTEATVGSNNLFEKDMQALRVIERIAMAIAIPTAYAVLRTAAS